MRPLPLVVAIGLLAGVAIGSAAVGCASAKHASTAGKVALIDCGKGYLPAAGSILARWGVDSALAGKPDWAGLERDALALGPAAGVCVYGEAVRAFRAKPTVQARVAEAMPQADDGSAGLERLRGGAQIKLADGTLL